MSEVINIEEIFGEDVFNDKAMREKLPKKIYEELKKTMLEGGEISSVVADSVAHAMKEWAIEKGATHYTHWFQPLTGVTAVMLSGRAVICFPCSCRSCMPCLSVTSYSTYSCRHCASASRNAGMLSSTLPDIRCTVPRI